MIELGEHLRLQPVMRGREQGYHYEREVEEFLRWSPHVRRERARGRRAIAAARIWRRRSGNLNRRIAPCEARVNG